MDSLPPDAATWQLNGWTTDRHIAATQLEVTDMWGRILAQALGIKRSRLPKPIEITRPGSEKPKRNVVSVDEFARMQQGGR